MDGAVWGCVSPAAHVLAPLRPAQGDPTASWLDAEAGAGGRRLWPDPHEGQQEPSLSSDIAGGALGGSEGRLG